ncbi:MAG: type II secretion system ATPase GspE [Myxococcota bacterium]
MELLGEIIVREFSLEPSKIEEALLVQRQKGGRIGEILIGMRAINERQLAKALSIQSGVPLADTIKAEKVDIELIKDLPINYLKQHRLIPVELNERYVLILIADPYNLTPIDVVASLFKRPYRLILAPSDEVISVINGVFDRKSQEAEAVMDDMATANLGELASELNEPQDLLDAGDEAPIIRLVNSLFAQAIRERASDIHIEPYEKEIVVRFRIDGVLYEIIKPAKRFHSSICSRIKIMAGLNIAEKRLPQDGRIRFKIAGKDIDVRVSVIPTAHGERIVMRLLDKSAVILDLEQLGIFDDKLKVVRELIRRSHGIILVTGPTGSGKTTTLYAALSDINSPDINILTAEDPIEYQIKGISQLQVNPKIGLTFAGALRSFLRQDPDVILVGEIRDLETAEIAIQASLTGHLVLSTLHTNDAATAVTRLVDMGVEPFLVASSLLAVMAQRLVRVVCPECRVPYMPTYEEMAKIGLSSEEVKKKGFIYKSQGCVKCMKTGYAGRIGIYELLIIDDEIRHLVLKNTDSTQIKKLAVLKGMDTLRDDGAKKVLQGITTIDEVLRVTQEDVF